MKAGWRVVPLGDVCTVVAGQSPDGSAYNDRKDGLPFYQGKKEFTDRYLGPATTWTTQVTKIAEADDILMSVRAPVGPINLATERICIGRGLAAIRPKTGLDVGFLWYALLWMQPKITGSEGAVFASINRDQICALSIPLSPLNEQKRIVAVLDEAFEGLSRARANAEANLADADQLFVAALDRIFRIEGAIWPTATLPSVCLEFGRGKSRHRPRNDPRLYDGPYPFIQTGDISRAGHLLTDYEQTYSDFGLEQSKLWKAGTVCVAIVGATIGESAVTAFDCCFPDSIIGMTPDTQKADAEFVEYALCCFKADLKEAGKGSARDNINLATFEGRQFPMPDVQTQRSVVERLKETSRLKEEIKSECRLRLASLESLRQSLLQKAFAGELTAAKPVASTGNADLDAVLDELFADGATGVAPTHDPDAARRVKRIREILSDEWNGE